jgi:hypothetical protein
MTQLGTCLGKRQGYTQLILSHLWGTDMSYRFKQTKNWGQGTKVCTV